MVRFWTVPLWAFLPVLGRGKNKLRGAFEDEFAVVRRQSDAPDPDSYRLRAHHRVAVLDNYLYIVGGQISQLINREEDDRDSRPVNSTLSIALDEEWTNSSASFKITDKGDFPAVRNTGLWIDNIEKRLYTWGGEAPSGSEQVSEEKTMWVFEPDGEGGGEWSNQKPANEHDFFRAYRTAEAGCATCGNTGFCLGGMANEDTDEDVEWKGDGTRLIQRLVSLDMESKEWTNYGTDRFNPPYLSYRSGQAVCGSAGDSNPFLFFLGGEAYEGLSTKNDPEKMQFFNLTWFDSEAGTWHWQRTSGDIPPPRSNFCAAGVRGPNGTYDVFIYGGHNSYGGESKSLSDIYILSIPAFQWFGVNVKGTSRAFHQCAATNSGQIIVVGGVDYFTERGDRHWWARTDEWPQGLGVFDLHSLQWRDSYDPEAAPYKIPDIIRDWYAEGGLDNVAWSSDEVKSMFAAFQFSSNSGAFGGSDVEEGNKSSTGAKVGGAIGGAIAFLAACGLVWWFLRRKRSRDLPMGSPGQEFRTRGMDASSLQLLRSKASSVYSPSEEVHKTNAQEMDALGYRDPPSPQELYDPGSYQMQSRQELHAPGYRLVDQEL